MGLTPSPPAAGRGSQFSRPRRPRRREPWPEKPASLFLPPEFAWRCLVGNKSFWGVCGGWVLLLPLSLYYYAHRPGPPFTDLAAGEMDEEMELRMGVGQRKRKRRREKSYAFRCCFLFFGSTQQAQWRIRPQFTSREGGPFCGACSAWQNCTRTF